MDDPDLRTRLDRHLARQAGRRPPADFESHILERVPAARSRRGRWVPEAVAVLVGVAMIGGLFLAVRGTRPASTPPPASSLIPGPALLSGAGAQVAWLLIQMQDQSHEVGIVGVDPGAHIVRKLVPFVGMRSGDGNRLIASYLTGQQIHVISAATGEAQRTVATQLDGVIRSVSWDGRFAVKETGTQVELVDVDAGKSLGTVELGPAGGGVLGVSRDGKHVYVCCKAQRLTSLVWDGTSLQVEAQAIDGKDGHRLPGCGSPPATSRMLPDGRTLVAYCPDGNRVWWLDLERLTVTKELPVEQGNPFWLAPIWAPDGSMLYLHEPRTNSFQAVDLRRQTLVFKTKLPIARIPDPLRWLAERFVISAEAGCVGQTGAVSPDGQILYLLDGRGLSVRRLPDLSVKSYWRRDAGIDALWLSGDGGTLYASDHDRVSVFGGDGRLVADAKPGASISGCAW